MRARRYLYIVPIVPGLIALLIWAYTLSAAGGDYGALSRAFSLERIALIVVFSSVASASVIEIIKRVTPIRGGFQLGAVVDWLGGAAAEELQRHLTARGGMGRRRRFAPFDVPVEQLSARVGYVLTDVASSPWKAPVLALRLADPSDAGKSALLRFIRDSQLAASVGDDEEYGPLVPEVRQAWREESGDFELTAQARLDAFQLETTRAWRRYLTWLSIAVSAFVGALVSFILIADWLTLGLTLGLCATIGAFLSWLVRDITAGVERWRMHA